MKVTMAHSFSFSSPKLRALEVHSNSNPNNAITFNFIRNRKRNLNLSCRCMSSPLNWDWNQWIRHFSNIQSMDSYASFLQFDLDEALDLEHLKEAVRLKKAVDEATSNDIIPQIMSQLKSCIDDERYYDAATLCTQTGCGLVGWWVGYTKDSDDPVGKIIRIRPGVGRFIGESYTPSQLLSEFEFSGTPIFEIYVVKNIDGTYQMQVVHLQRPKRNSMSKHEAENDESSVDNIYQEYEEKVEKTDEILNPTKQVCFLKDKIPAEKNDSDSDSDFDGGVLYIRNRRLVIDKFIRLPAELQDIEGKSFVLHILGKNLDENIRKRKMQEIYKAALAAQDLVDSMRFEYIERLAFNKLKVVKCVHKVIKSAINKAHIRGRRLSEYTSFSRITNSIDDSDPFDGLYVGSLGAYGSQVVIQLRRKFGNWNDVGYKHGKDTQNFEYVEAVKVIGDLHVPAGEVAFRAKIGRNNCNRFPRVSGVDAIYEGQVRVADFGFKNPRWVDGTLKVFNDDKDLDAEMGLHYVTPNGRSFGVALKRVKLP